MGAKKLSSRAIIGTFYATLEQDIGLSWVDKITNLFQSDQEIEEYAWLGMSPSMREWIGGRHAKGLRENSMLLRNKLYESTMEIKSDWIRRDKTDQINVRIREQAERANAHWAKLVAALIEAGTASVTYDGQYFFDTDHAEGDSGTQSNSITYDVTTTTAPTAGEMESAVLKGVEQVLSLKDDQGEPLNETALNFMIYCPIKFLGSAAAALGSQIIVDSSTSRSNRILTLGSMGGYSMQLAASPRSTWTDKFAIFRTDAATMPFIRQEETELEVAAIAEGSELEFEHRMHHYGISASRAAGFGAWQRAVLITLI